MTGVYFLPEQQHEQPFPTNKVADSTVYQAQSISTKGTRNCGKVQRTLQHIPEMPVLEPLEQTVHDQKPNRSNPARQASDSTLTSGFPSADLGLIRL